MFKPPSFSFTRSLIIDILPLAETLKHEPLTPPTSDTDQPESPESSQTDEETYAVAGGMVDSSRVFMCMFLFAVLLFNPFR